MTELDGRADAHTGRKGDRRAFQKAPRFLGLSLTLRAHPPNIHLPSRGHTPHDLLVMPCDAKTSMRSCSIRPSLILRILHLIAHHFPPANSTESLTPTPRTLQLARTTPFSTPAPSYPAIGARVTASARPHADSAVTPSHRHHHDRLGMLLDCPLCSFVRLPFLLSAGGFGTCESKVARSCAPAHTRPLPLLAD